MQSQSVSNTQGNLSVLSREIASLLSPKSRRKKKTTKISKHNSVLEMTKALLSDSSSDEELWHSNHKEKDSDPNSSCASDEYRHQSTHENSTASAQDISILTQEVDKLLILKPNKKCKLIKQKLPLQSIQESPHSVDYANNLTDKSKSNNKRKKQPSAQRKVLRDISHMVFSESSSDEQENSAKKCSSNEQSSNKENSVVIQNYNSQSKYNSQNDCESSSCSGNHSDTQDVENILYTTTLSGEVTNSFVKRTGECKTFKNQSMLAKDITAFIMSDSSADEACVDLDTKEINKMVVTDDSNIVIVPGMSTISTVPEADSIYGLSKQHTTQDTGVDLSVHVTDSEVANGHTERCKLKSVVNDSSSFEEINTSDPSESLDSEGSRQASHKVSSVAAALPENISVLSQEINTLLMTSEKKLKKKKRVHAITSLSLLNGNTYNATSKRKKQPAGQSKMLKQISELVMSDSASDHEACVASDKHVHIDETSVVNKSDLSQPEICNKILDLKLEHENRDDIHMSACSRDYSESVSLLRSHPYNDMNSCKMTEKDIITKCVDIPKNIVTEKSPECKNSSYELNPTVKVPDLKVSPNDLLSSSEDSDTSDGFSSVAAGVKTSDQRVVSDKATSCFISSDSSSDAEGNNLYKTALKGMTPESEVESDSEEDMLEQFLDRMKSDKDKTNSSGSSVQSHNMDSFIVSDDESLSGEDDNEFYLTTLSHQSQERSYEANSYKSDSSYPSFRTDSASSLKGKDNVHSLQTPKIQHLYISSDSDEDLLTPDEPVCFKTPSTTNISRVKRTEEAKNKKCSFLVCLSDSQDNKHQKDCEAMKYLKHFKKHKEELTAKLFAMYNQTVFESNLPADLTVEWNSRLLKTAGYCSYKKKVISATVTRMAKIELSTKVCDTAERVRDTLIHEMCHAAVWILHGSTEAHGPLWKLFARKANRVHPEVPTISRCHDYKINTKFTYKCTGCAYEIGRHSKSLDTERKVCGYCKSPFQLQLNSDKKAGSTGGAELTPRTPRTPNAFALFVKENYGSVKKEQRGISHKDLMQKLSRDFKATKQNPPLL